MFFLLILLWVTVIVEFIGAYINKNATSFSTNYLYHVYSFFEYNLIALMYLSIIKDKIVVTVIKLLMIVFNLFYIISCFFIEIQLYVVPIGSFMVATFLVFYFSELLKSNKILNYKKEVSFWVTVGFFIFYLPSIPFFSMLGYMKDRGLFFVLRILVILMNLFVLYGLLCSRKKI